MDLEIIETSDGVDKERQIPRTISHIWEKSKNSTEELVTGLDKKFAQVFQ